MKSSLAFFKIRFNEEIQYRSVAVAGVITQLCFACMYLMLYSTFMENNTATDMSIKQMASYVWLQQGFLEVLNIWSVDPNILDSIKTGNIVMDLVKPNSIYNMWYSKTLGRKTARLILKLIPLYIISILPIWGDYSCIVQLNPKLLILSIISIILSIGLNMCYIMILFALSMIFVSATNLKTTLRMFIEFGSGLVIPIAFMPNWVQSILRFTPFYYTQNLSFNIYSGYLSNTKQILFSLLLQLIWIVVLTFVSKAIINKRLKKLVIQGG